MFTLIKFAGDRVSCVYGCVEARVALQEVCAHRRSNFPVGIRSCSFSTEQQLQHHPRFPLDTHTPHTMHTSLRIPHSLQTNGQQCLRSLQQQQCRHVSSFRRTKKMLLVQPDQSFKSTTGSQDHIIYNPPSSAPNVYHTPLKFLPKDDPRRRLHTLLRPTSASASSTTALPPAVRPVYEKKYHLKEADIAEIRRLRAEDPRQWTRVRLAEKFECSQFFVSLCCSAPQIKDERNAELEKIKEKWGRTKTEAREDRQTRKQSWGKAV